MQKEWNAEFNRLVLWLAAGAAIGWMLGRPAWGLALVGIGYSGWTLLRARELLRWLRQDNGQEVPESRGLWGALFDLLYQRQKYQRQQLQQLQSVISRARQSTDAINDAVIVVNQHGELEWWNQAAIRLLGLQSHTDRGQAIGNLVRDPRFLRYFDDGLFDLPLEMPAPHHPGQILQFQITAFGEGDHLIVVRDVTRLHNLEQMRKDFVANVSHELRTPLTVIKGYLETFLDMMEPGDPALRRGLTQMQQQTRRMELLVNDLLLLSRLETERAAQPMKPVPVAQLLRQIHHDAMAINDDKQHHFALEVDETLQILGNDNELRSAFGNLVVNAVKYTPAQGNIHIRWWRDRRGACLAVQDNGIGIEAAHIPRLTERFYRADHSRHLKTGGTGLGLAIVKHVLIHHGAHLQIESTPGVGSTFTCIFPDNVLVPADALED